MKRANVMTALRKAAKGLLFISESEAPLEPIELDEGKLTPERLIELAGAEEGTSVEETTLARFFRAVPPEDKAKFDQLAKVLTEHLGKVVVYKIGDVEKQVYIVGKSEDGKWVGLKTSVVET